MTKGKVLPDARMATSKRGATLAGAFAAAGMLAVLTSVAPPPLHAAGIVQPNGALLLGGFDVRAGQETLHLGRLVTGRCHILRKGRASDAGRQQANGARGNPGGKRNFHRFPLLVAVWKTGILAGRFRAPSRYCVICSCPEHGRAAPGYVSGRVASPNPMPAAHQRQAARLCHRQPSISRWLPGLPSRKVM